MITVEKLLSLSPRHCARKASKEMEKLELAARAGELGSLPWFMHLLGELARATWPDERLRAIFLDMLGLARTGNPGSYVEALNRTRRCLEAYGGQSPADWDFLEPAGLKLDENGRKVFPGMRLFLEDIRSPFNVGAAFRTADAFGVEKLYLSGFCPGPDQPRAIRTSMGTSEIVPWERAELDELRDCGEFFALELGGDDLSTFAFPEKGIAILGSEELGVSREALALCKGRVSIPMYGAKASLNASIALGILLYAWSESLRARGILPVPVSLN